MIKKYSQLYFAGATQQQIDAAVKKLGVSPEELLSLANEADPTKENKFEAWVIKQMGLKKIQLPGQQKEIYNLLNIFIDLSNKRQLQERDINKYSYEGLQQEIKNIRGQDVAQSDIVKKYLQLEGVDIFGQNEDWLILRSEEPESSATLASGTKWCTSDPDVASDYESLFICFEKAGSHLTKSYQFTLDGTDLKDTQDNNPTSFPDSLAELIIYCYKTKYISKGYLAEVIKSMFASGWEPTPDRAKEVIEDIRIPFSEIYDTIDMTKQHDFRNGFLKYKERTLEEGYVIKLLNEYIDGFHDVPRWPEFEEGLLQGTLFSLKKEGVMPLLYKYLAGVQTQERIPVDTLCFKSEPEDISLWARNMYYYFHKFLNTGERIPEFEKLIEKIIKKSDASSNIVASLIGEYWIRVAKRTEEWLEVEDFLLSHQERGAFSSDGVYSSGWERYVQGVRG